jgi:site-specific DNA recombinase
VGGPEAIQDWIRTQGGLSAVRGLYTPGHHDTDSSTLCPADVITPVAFMGRTSTEDQQDPVGSLLRQLRISQAALPEGCVIVAYFYDVESGRKDLAARGQHRLYDHLAIPIPRDGSIQDLLGEATRPDCRFKAVICEQIDRVARTTYYGTFIEHQLKDADIALWAADERINLGSAAITDPTNILTRRVKQGIAEWYALDMIKRARDGFETHTDQGYNVGKPCYGFRAAQVRLDQRSHPDARPLQLDTAPGPSPGSGHRGKGRIGPRTKTKLISEPTEAAVVATIYQWRISERLGYQSIADRLNRDLVTNPPPAPPNPDRAVGFWTPGSVRDVLTQPKYTGYMVWNRRATKTRRGSPNPIDQWVWSSHPTHEAIITLDTFITVQQIVRRRERSRTQPGANTRHPQTKRSYLLRSYLFCTLCGRRMFGKTRRLCAYYACAPKKGYIPDGHPDSLWVREVSLLNSLHEFLTHHVFGPYRHSLLASTLTDIDRQAEHARAQRITTIKKTITDNDTRRKRLIHTLEVTDDIDQDFIQDIQNRRAQMKAENTKLQTELDELEQHIHEQPNPDLLNVLPVGTCDLADLPEDITRRLFEALRLEVHYDKQSNTAVCRITLTGETIPAVQQAASDGVVVPLRPHSTSPHQPQRKINSRPGAATPLFPSVTCPRQDSNLRSRLRRAVLYPLSYGGMPRASLPVLATHAQARRWSARRW